MASYLVDLSQRWIVYKTWLADNVGLTNDALHVHGGLLILVLTALIIRRRPDSILCWSIVLIAELFNEYSDIHGEAPGEATINAGLHDVYNTMFWPTVLLLTGWLLFPKRAKRIPVVENTDEPAEHGPSSGDLTDQSLKQPSAV